MLYLDASEPSLRSLEDVELAILYLADRESETSDTVVTDETNAALSNAAPEQIARKPSCDDLPSMFYCFV